MYLVPIRRHRRLTTRYADGFIFVVDNLDDSKALKKAKRTLETFLSPDPDLGLDTSHIEASAPLLVFLCDPKNEDKESKADRSELYVERRLSPAALADRLGLMDNLNGRISKWCVRSVCAETMSGIPEGLHWLAENI